MQVDLKNPKQLLKHTDGNIISKMRELLPQELHKNGIKFLVYLMNTIQKPSLMTRGSRYSVVLPSRFLDSHFEGAYRKKPGRISDVERLLELKIITRSNYSRDQHLCREYRIDSNFLLKLLSHCCTLGLPLLGDTKNPVTIPALQSPTHPSLAQPLPTVGMIQGVLSYSYYPALHASKLEQYIDDRYQKIEKQRLASKNPDHKRYKSAHDSLMNDYYKLAYMMRCGNSDQSGDFDYKRDFVVTSTGRVVERNGLQGLTRTAKAYIYAGDPEVFNYDLSNSQLTLLSHYCKRLNISTLWLDSYLADPEAKGRFAHLVGIDPAIWKQSLLSLVFGSNSGRWGTPYRLIYKSCSGNRKLADERYTRWKEHSSDFRIMCKQWLKSIRAWCVKNNVTSNAVGVTVDFSTLKRRSTWISAWLLQGLESAIIFKLMLEPEATYRVISQEFDGLVTHGQIPNHVFDSVIADLDLQNAGLKLEIKPFC